MVKKRDKMSLKQFLKKLEKKGIITRKPHPILPFVLGIAYFIITCISFSLYIKTKAQYFLIGTKINITLTIFTFIFAILHLIVVKIIKN